MAELQTDQRVKLPPWWGELGWEVMSFIPWHRAICVDAGVRGLARSFPGMEPLYDDFADFEAHEVGNGRSDIFQPRRYRVERIHRRYGNPDPRYRVLFHARGIARKAHYNYGRWLEVVQPFVGTNEAAFIGTSEDYYVEGIADERGAPLAELLDLMAGASVVVGVSSGPLHLAAVCGTDLIVWGKQWDGLCRYYGESLETRFKQTWNPHGVGVTWIRADDFNPDPKAIRDAVESKL